LAKLRTKKLVGGAMSLRITAAVERWPVAGQFIIARGAKTFVDVLVVAVSNGVHVGYGEGTAIYYQGETAEICLGQVERVIDQLEHHTVAEARALTQMLLPPGAARNALDCALWDLEAKETGTPLWQLAGLASAPKALQTAFTISLGEAAAMEADAANAAAKGYQLLKLKLTGEGDRNRVAAVRMGAPDARLIVDANESWGKLDIAAEATALVDIGVELIEQPVPAGQDDMLAGLKSPLPILADESCHTAADIARLASYYDGVNIKLDKAGGLTEALKIADAAKAAGMKSMVGCMLSTSLGIAPAFLVAQHAGWVDLDGPALLAEDRPCGFEFADGKIIPPANIL
jgi:L-alanine-DL-glutamate epimerase-like enolase superfamily enzyme